MRGKWLGAVALCLLGTAITMTAVVARKADQASRPASLCTLQFDGVMLENVLQVTTRVQMERGLSGLQEVGTGMLFTWSDDERRVFWMRGTPTPLSVAFIDPAGTVLQIQDMEPETEVMHWSTLPAREGLEMENGDFQRLGIAPGTRLIRRECKPVAEYQKQGM